MARHLAICERKSAYPSRNEAKSAIVTHSMLDVLGLVRKPEEGPSGIRRKIRSTKQEPAPAEEKNEIPQSTEAVEETLKTVEEEKDKDVNIIEESNNDEEDVEEIIEDVETVTVVEELEKHEVKDDSKAEEKDVESDKVESEKDEEVAKEQEVHLVDDEPEEIVESSKTVEEEKQPESTETVESENGLQTVEKSPEAAVVEEKSDEIEKDAENKEENVEREEAVEKHEALRETPVEDAEDIQSVGSHISEEAVCQKELEVPHEPVAAREQVSPVNEMETAEVVQDKTNSLGVEITSDDIQSIISDVVGEKSTAEMGFDESANMETESDVTAFSAQRQMEDVVPMQISQDESMEVPETNEVMECEETPMETD